MALSMFVPGIPRPQGSMRAFLAGGKARIRHADHDGLAVWRAAISTMATDLWGNHAALDEPVAVGAIFYLPRPASAPKRRIYPDRQPDLDKLLRAVLDSLEGIVLANDARVVSATIAKLYAYDEPTGARISVAPLAAVQDVPGPGTAREEIPAQPVSREIQRGSSAVGNRTTSGVGGAPREPWHYFDGMDG